MLVPKLFAIHYSKSNAFAAAISSEFSSIDMSGRKCFIKDLNKLTNIIIKKFLDMNYFIK